jgi:hypothetical protein
VPIDPTPIDPTLSDASPDNDERIRDFWQRHGGPGPRRSESGRLQGGSRWSEVYAADGYTLRCEWTEIGERHSMKFTERPPQPPNAVA